MGRFVTLDGGRTGPAVHVVDPGVPLETLVVDPNDLWRAQPAVRKVVNFAARNIASLPVDHFKRQDDGDREKLRDTRTARLLRKPAPFMTPYRFWHTITVDGLMFDRWCFTHLQPDEDGPEQFYRVPPTRFRIERDGMSNPERIVVWGKDSEEYHLPPDVCVFDSGYTSGWGDPIPPAQALADTLLESDEARKYRRELLVNGARIDTVIERPNDAKEWTDAAWERFRSQFAKYRAGGGSAGGTPVLEDGMQLKKVEAFDPNSMQILEARKLTEAEVATFFHIPPEMIGTREGTFSNLEAFRQMLWNISLGPLIVSWEQALNVMLLPVLGEDEDSTYIESNLESKLRGSWEEQLNSYVRAAGAPWMTRNEVRSKANMKKIPGGDELIVPLNVIAGGLANPADTAPDELTDKEPDPKV